MIITQFWEGDIPLRPMYFGLEDEFGNDIGGAGAYQLSVRLLDPNEREVDLKGSTLVTAMNSGFATFTFPEDRTVFLRSGDYRIQLGVRSGERMQWTSSHTIRVQKFGKRGRY